MNDMSVEQEFPCKGSIIVCMLCYVTNAAITEQQVTFAKALIQALTITELVGYLANDTLGGTFYSPEHTAPMSSKEDL